MSLIVANANAAILLAVLHAHQDRSHQLLTVGVLPPTRALEYLATTNRCQTHG